MKSTVVIMHDEHHLDNDNHVDSSQGEQQRVKKETLTITVSC